MKDKLPTPDEVRAKLQGIQRSELRDLADAAAVPIHTLLKIRSGETKDPQLSTVCALWRVLGKRRRVAA